MAQENVEIVRNLYDAWNGPNGREEVIAFLSDDFEWVNPGHALEPGTRRGHAGWSQAMDSLDAAFRRYAHELESVRDLGGRVLCFTTFVAWAGGYSEAFRQTELHLWTLRDDQATRLHWFHDRAVALEAAGLTE